MPRIRLEDNGLPLAEDLKTLSIQEWMAWIQARQSEYDPFTGQMLGGTVNALALVREAVIRLQGTRSVARLTEASSQLLRDELLFFLQQKLMERSDQGECVRRAFVLVDFLCFLEKLPTKALEESHAFRARFNECQKLIEHHEWAIDKQGWDKDAYLYLIAACMRFLEAHQYVLSRAQAEFWLHHSSTARIAMEILLKQFPARRIHWYAECVRTLLRDEMSHLTPGVLEPLRRTQSKSGRSPFSQVLHRLSAKQRAMVRRELANASSF